MSGAGGQVRQTLSISGMHKRKNGVSEMRSQFALIIDKTASVCWLLDTARFGKISRRTSDGIICVFGLENQIVRNVNASGGRL